MFLTFLAIFFVILMIDKNIFHPSNMVAAFSFLYVVLPRAVEHVYSIFNLERVLPWGDYWQQLAVSDIVVLDILFFSLLVSFSLKLSLLYGYKKICLRLDDRDDFFSNSSFLGVFVFSALMFFLLVFFMNKTGGLSGWVDNYSSTYLTGKKGLGWLNIILIYSSNLFAFVLGLYFFYGSRSRNRLSLMIFAFFVLFLAAYLQGFKSRIPYFFILFFAPRVAFCKCSMIKYAGLGLFFLVFFSFAMWIRNGDFYSSPSRIFEYMGSYFNIIRLHAFVVEDYAQGAIFSIDSFVNKWMSLLGGNRSVTDFDISYFLTERYFPEQWALSATQQWPLVSELYLSLPSRLTWPVVVPFVIMLSIISSFALRSNVKSFRTWALFVFVSEFLRLFTTLRGALIPWQLPLILAFYIGSYFVFRFIDLRFRLREKVKLS